MDTLKWAEDILAGRILIFDVDWAKKQAKDALEYARDFYHDEAEKFYRVATEALNEAKSLQQRCGVYDTLISSLPNSATRSEVLSSKAKLLMKINECIDRHDKATEAADKALSISNAYLAKASNY